MSQIKKPAKKAESTVIKPMAKKDRYSSLGGEIGEPPFGGKKPKPGTKIFNGVTGKYDVTKKNGGPVKAKNGKPVKKAFLGGLLGGAGKSMLGGMGKQMLGGLAGKALGGLMGKNGKTVKKAKSGGSMKKCKYGCK
jgi:hypothetical protein